MKKLNSRQKIRSRKLHFKILSKLRIYAGYKKDKKLKKKFSKHRKEVIKISAPSVFSLAAYEERKHLLEFLSKIKNFLSQGKHIHISFNKTHLLVPCGTIWATSRIESLVESYPNKISCSYPKNNIVEQLFQHIGLLAKLGKTVPRANIDSDNVRFWHYVYGRSTDDVSQFKELLNSISLPDNTKSGLFESMSEAVTNTIHWAFEDGQTKEWRMFAQHKEGKLTVAICDMGMGIPTSLRQKPELGEVFTHPIRSFMNRIDTSLIEIAVESTRSSTRLPHRGKGLRDMLNLVKSGTVGGFVIYSNKGAFVYNAARNEELSGGDMERAINGTIIIWELSLEASYE